MSEAREGEAREGEACEDKHVMVKHVKVKHVRENHVMRLRCCVSPIGRDKTRGTRSQFLISPSLHHTIILTRTRT